MLLDIISFGAPLLLNIAVIVLLPMLQNLQPTRTQAVAAKKKALELTSFYVHCLSGLVQLIIIVLSIVYIIINRSKVESVAQGIILLHACVYDGMWLLFTCPFVVWFIQWAKNGTYDNFEYFGELGFVSVLCALVGLVTSAVFGSISGGAAKLLGTAIASVYAAAVY